MVQKGPCKEVGNKRFVRALVPAFAHCWPVNAKLGFLTSLLNTPTVVISTKAGTQAGF